MNSKYEKINENDINFSHVGNASAKKYLYILDKKNYLKKKHEKIIPNDFLYQEEETDIYNNMYEKEEFEENIFDDDYKNKYKNFLEEQKQKYFNLKKSCIILPEKKNKKRFLDKKKDNNMKEKKLIEKLNDDKFKYHLIHHYHDYYLDKSLINLNNHSCITYNPKMEYIFKKINYSTEFKKMRGRYDQQNIKEIIKKKLEDNINKLKEKEYKKKIEKLKKIRTSINISHKELLNENIKIYNKLKRHNSANEIISENRNINLILLKNNIPEKTNDEIINESRNFKRKLFKRTNTTTNISFSFGFKKNLYNKDENKIIEEDEDKIVEKINLSNNNEENTLISSSNHNKTISGKKKENSLNSNETDIICINNNISRNESIKKSNKNKDILSYNYKNKSKNNSCINNKIDKNNILPLINNKVVNFDKMLSREYFHKIKERKRNIYYSLCPNYESIRPKCIMKVIYSKKNVKKYRNKEFKSYFNEIVFDANKHINDYNNHLPPKNIYLDKITGKNINNNSPFPSYMINQYNRNAFNTFNDKSFEMNNYSNGNLKELKSSFNDKKSFNYKINNQCCDNKSEYFNKEINSIMKKIIKKPIYNKRNYRVLSCSNNSKILDYSNKLKFNSNSSFLSKIPEYYKFNLDNLGHYYIGDKIDGITLKAIKSNKSAIDILNKKEINIFL